MLMKERKMHQKASIVVRLAKYMPTSISYPPVIQGAIPSQLFYIFHSIE